jgi:hypothetical protein
VSGVDQYSSSLAFTYGDPYITSLQNVAGQTLGKSDTTDIVLEGTNFGTYGDVIVSGSSVATTSWTHTRITLTYVGSEGNATVKVSLTGSRGWEKILVSKWVVSSQVGTKYSNTVAFDDSSPIIYFGLSQYSPDPKGDPVQSACFIRPPASLAPALPFTRLPWDRAVENGKPSESDHCGKILRF